MRANAKVFIGIAAAVLAGAAGLALLPWMAQRIDATMAPRWEKSAGLEGQYRDMTNLFRVASESPPDHPSALRWTECREALLLAGYLETRSLRLGHSLGGRSAVPRFFTAVQARFPGIEMRVSEVKSDAPLVVVTARKDDLGPWGAVETFIRNYSDPEEKNIPGR